MNLIMCEGCPVVAICRTKVYDKLITECIHMRHLITSSDEIKTDLQKVEEILNPVMWETKVEKYASGRVVLSVMEKSKSRYVRIEAEYDLCEYASYNMDCQGNMRGAKCAK